MSENKIVVSKNRDEQKQAAKTYNDKNIKTQEQYERTYVMGNGTKKKIYKEIMFKNGVKKTELVGMTKNGKIMIDRGVKWDKVKK